MISVSCILCPTFQSTVERMRQVPSTGWPSKYDKLDSSPVFSDLELILTVTPIALADITKMYHSSSIFLIFPPYRDSLRQLFQLISNMDCAKVAILVDLTVISPPLYSFWGKGYVTPPPHHDLISPHLGFSTPNPKTWIFTPLKNDPLGDGNTIHDYRERTLQSFELSIQNTINL